MHPFKWNAYFARRQDSDSWNKAIPKFRTHLGFLESQDSSSYSRPFFLGDSVDRRRRWTRSYLKKKSHENWSWSSVLGSFLD